MNLNKKYKLSFSYNIPRREIKRLWSNRNAQVISAIVGALESAAEGLFDS